MASIIRAMEAVRTSEMSVNFSLTTRRYIPEDSKLHTRRRENLKSHILGAVNSGIDVTKQLTVVALCTA
jgi:hypothetical protein